MLELHTEVHGHGPALVLIPGGGGDAGMYEDVVPLLARHHTVITYDRRGNSRSPFTGADTSVAVPDQADDLVGILDRLDIEKATVFGNSGGAVIALDLLARHAERITSAVVHEPPVVGILGPDSPEYRALHDIFRLSRDTSVMHAFAAFGAMTMQDPPWLFRSPTGQGIVAVGSRLMLAAGGAIRKLTGTQADTMTRMLGNAEVLIGRELPAFCFDYEVDVEALRVSEVPWVLAGGADSTGKPYDRPGKVLAERIGVEHVEFPGGHTIYQDAPEAFVARLTEVMEGLK